MNCGRCEGLMLEGDFIDMEESCGGMWLRAWRCLSCGHATDSVMVVNRQLHALRLASQVEHKDNPVEEDSRTLGSLAA